MRKIRTNISVPRAILSIVARMCKKTDSRKRGEIIEKISDKRRKEQEQDKAEII